MKKIFQYQYSAVVLGFLGVLAIYWLYTGAVAPFVLSRDPDFSALISDVDSIPLDEMEWKKYLANLFSEERWERNSRYSIWKDNFVLLFDEHKQTGNQVELKPCTVLFLNGEHGKDDEALFQQAIILQSTNSAVLEFDGPFSPLSGSKAKFVKGRLSGEVSIHSSMKDPGPDDDLSLTTREVVFNDSQIQANFDIDFRFGMSHGTGKSLYIFLSPSDPKNSKSAKTISRVELQQVKKINLNMPSKQKSVTGETQYDRFEVTCNDKIEFAPDPDSDIYWVGTFNKDVNVARIVEGYYDHLECGQLSVQFVPQPKPGEKPITNNNLDSLQQISPLKMLAVGNVKVRSPNNDDFLAEGHKLEYDFEKERLILDSDLAMGKTVKMSRYGGKQWVVGKKIAYTAGKNGQFGELFAPNGGKLSGIMSPEKSQENSRTFQMDWADNLQAFPDPEDPEFVRCQLFGQMSLNVENLGTMYAKETVIWFKQERKNAQQPPESPPASSRNPLIQTAQGNFPNLTPYEIRQVADSTPAASSPVPVLSSGILPQKTALTSSNQTQQPQQPQQPFSAGSFTSGFQSLTPDHARIRKDVRFVTPNGVCNVREMNVWFYEDGQEIPGPQYANSHVGGPSIADASLTTTPASPKNSASSSSFLGNNSDGESQYELLGDTMELLVKMRGNRMEIDRMFLNGLGKQVSLIETNPKQSSDPIRLFGTELRAWSPSSDHSVVQLLGTTAIPASIAGMESTLTGLDIILNQQTNQIEIKGGGQITSTQLVLSSDLSSAITGMPTTQSKPVPPIASQKKLLVVRWNGGMKFDGTRITFEKNVAAQYPLQELYCNIMNIDLDRPISLIQPKSTQDPQVRRVECLGKVFFVCEEREENKTKSVLKGENLDQIQIYPATGRFDGTAEGTGQGRLRATLLDEGSSGSLTGNPSSEQRTNAGLMRIDLYFFGRVLGNFKAFEATATESVVCVYCPVTKWDEEVDMDDRDFLKDNEGYRLDCDILEVAKMVDPLSQKQGVELTASGSTKIEGKQIFARAESVKFNQIKETVILEGSGPIPAEVHVQRTPNGDFEEPIFVQQFIYNIRTKNFESKGARGTQFLK